MKKKLVSLLLSGAMLLSLAVPAMAAEETKTAEPKFADTVEHWGAASAERWAEVGVLKGDQYGNFLPDKEMSRAEFAQMLCNLMGYTKKAENVFTDVAEGDWYADAILKLAAAGVMQGTSETTASPNAPITREQAAVLLCRALSLKPSKDAKVDLTGVSSWAADAMTALAERKMMNGNENGDLMPLVNINRASVAQLVDNMVSTYVTEDGATVSEDQTGIVIVAAKDVTIKDAKLAETLVVAPSAEGTTTLTGKTEAADVVVAAEGAKVVVDAKATAGAVTVAADKASAEIAGKADSFAVNGAEAAVTVAKGGTVTDVTVEGEKAGVTVAGKVTTVTVGEDASDTSVTVEKGATISKVETAADNVSIDGSGKVTTVTVTGGEGTTVAKGTASKVENKSDNTVSVGGKDVDPGKTQGSTSSGGGSGSSGGSGNTPAETTKYTVTLSDTSGITDGTVALSGDTDGEAAANATITITITGKNGKVFKSATYTVSYTNPEDGQTAYVPVTETATGATFTMPAANVNVTVSNATFDDVTYAITTEVKGGTAEDVTVADKAKAGVEVTITVETKTGYDAIISVKDVDGETVDVTNGKFTMPAKAVTVTVEYKAKEISVTLNVGGKTVSEADTISAGVKVTFGAAPTTIPTTLTDTAEDPATFLGWTKTAADATTADIGNYLDADGNWAEATDTTLYAVWRENGVEAHAVTIDETVKDYISTALAEYAKDEKVAIVVTPAEGYQLKENSLKVTKDGETPTDVTVESDNTFTMPDGAVTITAQFEKAKYALTWTDKYIDTVNTNLSSGDDVEFDADVTVALKAADLKTDDVTVTAVKLGDVALTAGTGDDANTYTGKMPAKAAAITVEVEANTHTVTLAPLTGSNMKLDKTSAKKGDIVTLTVYGTPNGTEIDEVTAAAATEGAAAITVTDKKTTPPTYTFEMPADDVTVTVKTKAIEYTVTFDLDDGTASTEGDVKTDNQTVEWGKTASKPTNDPTKANSDFKGWFVVEKSTDAIADDAKEYDFSTAVKSDLILKAKWEAYYTVSYGNATLVKIGGKDWTTKFYESTTDIVLPGIAEDNTKEFVGWQLGDVLVTDANKVELFKAAAKTATNSTITLKPMWVTEQTIALRGVGVCYAGDHGNAKHNLAEDKKNEACDWGDNYQDIYTALGIEFSNNTLTIDTTKFAADDFTTPEHMEDVLGGDNGILVALKVEGPSGATNWGFKTKAQGDATSPEAQPTGDTAPTAAAQVLVNDCTAVGKVSAALDTTNTDKGIDVVNNALHVHVGTRMTATKGETGEYTFATTQKEAATEKTAIYLVWTKAAADDTAADASTPAGDVIGVTKVVLTRTWKVATAPAEGGGSSDGSGR